MSFFNRFRFFGILFVFIFLNSCKKDASIRGRIYNQHTGVGMEDVPMRLFVSRNNQENGASWTYNNSGKDGYFNVKTKAHKKDVGRLIVDIDTFKYHVFFNPRIDLSNLSESGILNLEVLTKKQVEFHPKNNSGYTNMQLLRFDLVFTHEKVGQLGFYNKKILFSPDINYYFYYGHGVLMDLIEGKVTVTGSYTVSNGPAIPVNQSYIIKGETNKIQMLELGV